jgi:hypothetical protein
MRHLSQHRYNEFEIEKAIVFLSDAMRQSGHNSKPVVLHSIRVASILWNNGLEEASVIAAILHDVIEDSDTTYEDVKNGFGSEVADIVLSLTQSRGLDITESYERSKALGLKAQVVRAADLIDNSFYYKLAGNPELEKKLYDKYKLFMSQSKEILKDTQLGSLLNEAYELNVEPLKNVVE